MNDSIDLTNLQPGKPAKTVNRTPANTNRLPVVALIADVENWAFHNISKQIVKHLSDSYEFKIFFYGEYKEIEELMLEVRDYDLVHFFWRDAAFSLLSSYVQYSLKEKGWEYTDFIANVLSKANITSTIFDHLLLSEAQIQERIILYNALIIGYSAASQRLFELYSSITDYPNPYMVVEDGVDLERFVPQNLERLADEDREIIVGWVGYSKWGGDGIDHKGLETIIKPAIADLQTEGYKVRGFYADRHERWIPHDEMTDYYNSIDIYICASDIEGTPNPALESMACGLPVISTNVGIVPELFGRQQQEYILPERSIEALKTKLRELIVSSQRRVALSQENIEEIKKWSWKNQCQKWHTFFQSMLLYSQNEYEIKRRNLLREQLLKMYIQSISVQNLETVSENILENIIEDNIEGINSNVQYQELKEFSSQLQLKIDLMEQSRFWKVRSQWFKLKKKVGLAKMQN